MTSPNTPQMPELLPCPFDGNLPNFDHYGTSFALTCPVCACGPDIQLSDLMTMEERQAMEFNIHAKDYGYPQEVVHRVADELVKCWNTRADLSRAPSQESEDRKMDAATLEDLRSMIFTVCAETAGRTNEVACLALTQVDKLRSSSQLKDAASGGEKCKRCDGTGRWGSSEAPDLYDCEFCKTRRSLAANGYPKDAGTGGESIGAFEVAGETRCVHGHCRLPITKRNSMRQGFCDRHFKADSYTLEDQEKDMAAEQPDAENGIGPNEALLILADSSSLPEQERYALEQTIRRSFTATSELRGKIEGLLDDAKIKIEKLKHSVTKEKPECWTDAEFKFMNDTAVAHNVGLWQVAKVLESARSDVLAIIDNGGK